ncbi:DM13 domain-containing protein [Paraoerskovia marina]|uniref:DM13 domain-containing protein n=1 Tax=Paraoerskovia marina TaxID=545619 RepID=UPI000492ACE6|nr:DM13 domain-containing protein [Paraoerskovia marina]
MTTDATATITGHEARGRAVLEREADGSAVVRLTDFWVAPGAPDVRLYVTAREDGRVDRSAVQLGRVPDRTPELSFPVPDGVDVADLRHVVVHCTVYSVYFGAGEWLRVDR